METRHGTDEGIRRAKLTLQSLAQTSIQVVKYADIGKPLKFDRMAFWSHKIAYLAAMVHVRLGERNSAWEADFEVLKKYLSL